jgi:DNA-directed RNA polymerase subunit K/omega
VLEQVKARGGNTLTDMIAGGAKGSAFNVGQIIASVGQQSLQGRRLDRNNVYFDRTDPTTDVDARGFIQSSFMDGLNPAEFVALMAGGREGLIDTALNTADSGHLHHMIIKTAEDIKVDHDGKVVNSYGVVFQFAYGDDGLNPEYLQRVQTPSGGLLSFIHLASEIERLNAKYGYGPGTDDAGVVEGAAPARAPEPGAGRPRLTRYERARLLGTRSAQLSQGAAPAIDVPPGLGSLAVAERELAAGVLPLMLRRYRSDGTYQDWRLDQLETGP